ncbi:MAG: translocation/assembly module TamB domain-containing protein [Candidatus Contendobacter sp.]|nr:translocation/assembly module TamB domain-containing protein [Candidatus Contendobacter sp.]
MNALRIVRRLAFGLIQLFLSTLLLILLLAGFAVSTETGFGSLLALAERVLPGTLRVGSFSGRLLGPLRIEQLHYEGNGLKLALAKGEFDWQPAKLFEIALTVHRLQIDGLELQLPPSQQTASPPTSAPLTLPDIRLPLAINIDDLQGHAIRIQPAGVEPIVLDTIRLKAHTEAEGLTIETLEVRAPQGEARLSGRLNPIGGYPLQVRLNWQLPTPAYGTFHGQGELQGELRDRLQLTQRITGAATLDLNGEIHQPFDPQPAWSAQAKLNVADLKPFVPDLAGKPLAVQLDARGVLARFEGQGEVNTTLPELGSATLKFTATGDEQALELSELRLTAADRPLALTAQGGLQFADLRFNASGQWRALAWPLTGPAQVESAQGTFTAEGVPKDYQFQLAAEVEGPDIPKGRWTLTGQGSDQGVRAVKLNGQTLEGTIQGNADVAWLPTVRWQTELSGAELNPGAHWQDVPGKLNLRLKSDGDLEDARLRANFLLEELAGTLGGQAVRGNADIAVLDRNLTIKTLKINAGDARLEADGALAQRWDLRWKLDAPQLKSLLPGLSGAIASSGNLSGPSDRPVVAANFTVRDLRQGQTQIQQLRGEAHVDIGGASRSQLKINGEGLTLGGQNWKSFTLDGGGTPAAHDLKAELTGEPGRFLLALAGSLQTSSLLWQGRVTQLSAKDTVAGTWNLDKPALLRASAKAAGLDAACLSSAPTRVCLQGQWESSGAFNGRVQLSELTPDRFKPLLPQGLTLVTRIGGEASASGKIGGALQGKANLNIAPGHLSMEANGQPVRFTLNGGSVQVQTDGSTASGQARLDLAQTGQLQANLQAQNPFGAARLSGKINAALTDLKVVSAFTPQVQNVTGQLRADVNIAGTIPKLALRGDIRLENAGASIPEAGIKLENLQFTATSDGQGPLRLSGAVRSDPGQLQLSGEVDPLKPHLKLTVQGQNFQALKTTDLQIQLSPDLQLDATRPQVQVEGTVTIPKAYLRPGGERPGAIKASDDVVLVNGADDHAPPKPKGLDIFAKVRVILGNDVQVETPAFKGKLKGNLLIEETPQLAPRGSGSIEVVAGNYRIYGEEIQIQRGQLLFSSSLLDNPGLDLRVVRQSADSAFTGTPITAGAQIRGTLKNPKMTLFSEPKMPDSSILSYLVLGRAPQSSGAGGGEAALLFKAANAVGLGGNNTLTQSLSETFGLDALQLGSSGDSSKGTALMLGKYLTPDLYVGYGVGLLGAVNTFNVKYRLSNRLLFESNSSATGTGADLIYTFER